MNTFILKFIFGPRNTLTHSHNQRGIEPTAVTMSESDHDNPNVKVYCRLRPMNKLEMSRRSKNCVYLPEDDPRCITVDSPLEGEYDFFFDRVSTFCDSWNINGTQLIMK
jgi:hypothetical protein